MHDKVDLRLADHVAASVCDAVAEALGEAATPEQAARHLRMIRLLWAGGAVPVPVAELCRMAAEAARRGVLRPAAPFRDAVLPADAARIVLALVHAIGSDLPPEHDCGITGDAAGGVVLVPLGPGARWPAALGAALAAGAGPRPCGAGAAAKLDYALLVARASGWRLSLLMGMDGGPVPLLLAPA